VASGTAASRHDGARDRAGPRQQGRRERDHRVDQRVERRLVAAREGDRGEAPRDQRERHLDVGEVAGDRQPERDPLGARARRLEAETPRDGRRDQRRDRRDQERRPEPGALLAEHRAVDRPGGDQRAGERAGERADRRLAGPAERSGQPHGLASSRGVTDSTSSPG
jgi:hypothetical protein